MVRWAWLSLAVLAAAACSAGPATTTGPSASFVAPTALPTASPTKPAPSAAAPTPSATEVATMSFTVTSSSFAEGGPIPKENTCDGADEPLSIAWSGVPAGTAQLALVMDDPDANG